MFVSLSITEKSEDKTVNVKIWQCNVPFTESCVLLRANQTQVPVLLESLSGSHGEEQHWAPGAPPPQQGLYILVQYCYVIVLVHVSCPLSLILLSPGLLLL